MKKKLPPWKRHSFLKKTSGSKKNVFLPRNILPDYLETSVFKIGQKEGFGFGAGFN